MSSESVSRRDVLGMGAALLATDAAGAQPASSMSAAGSSAAPAAAASTAPPQIDRAFLRLREGLVHYRSAGDPHARGALPLYLAHAGPGSSRSFETLLPRLGQRGFAFAPDMLGNGDSALPARDDVDMAYYVDCAIRVMDALKIERVDWFGSHTGAQIGCQLAARHPQRVRRLVLDGVPMFPDEFKQQLLARYAPRVVPDDYGGHLIWAWNFVRDQSQYWPYFDRQSANRLANGIAPAEQLQLAVADVIRALPTYHVAYHAAFAQDLRPILPQLRCPVLMMASERDPLSRYLDAAAALVPQARKLLLSRTASPAERIDAVEQFLAG